MKKKLTGLFLALAVMFCLMPLLPASAYTRAAAAPFSAVYIGVTTANGTETRKMTNGSYLDGNYNLQYSVPSYGYVARYLDGVLTLSNFNCTKIHTPASETGSLTIDLIGKNTIKAGQTGISINGRNGSSLTITSRQNGSLAISTSGDMARGISAGDTNSAYKSVAIGGNAKLSINVRGDGGVRAGIVANSISVTDRASLDITVRGLNHSTSSKGFLYGILTSSNSSGSSKFLLDTTGVVNIDVSDINADSGYSHGITSTGGMDLRHVGNMTIRWTTTDDRYGGPIVPAGSEFSKEHAVNIDSNNCYASYRAGKPYNVKVSYGKLTGPGVPYPKATGNFLWYDEITLSANDYTVSDTDPTPVPFVRWEAEQGTLTNPDSKSGAKLNFMDIPTADVINVEAVHSAFSEVPVFIPTDENKGTLFFKLFSKGRRLYLVKADTLEVVNAGGFLSSSYETGEATYYYIFGKTLHLPGEYIIRADYGTTAFYSRPFTMDYTATDNPNAITITNQSGHFAIDQEQHARLFAIAKCQTAGVRYQWQRLEDATGWTNIPGAEYYDYRVEGTDPGETLYRCVISNKYGVVKYSNTMSVTVNANPTLDRTPAYILPVINEPQPDIARLWPDKVIDYYDLISWQFSKEYEYDMTVGEQFYATVSYRHIPGDQGYNMELPSSTILPLYYDLDKEKELTAVLGEISYLWEVTRETDRYGFPTNYYKVGDGSRQNFTMPDGVEKYWGKLTITNTIGTGEYKKEKNSYISLVFNVSPKTADSASVSGTVTSFNSDTDDVIIQLIQSGTSEAAYETIVHGNTASYNIPSVASGSYTMKVIKNNHVTREYPITVAQNNVTQNAKIHLKGDINGDGRVNTMDVGLANSHARNKSTLKDYRFKCADVTGDGRINTMDVGRINSHARSKVSLW